LTAARDAQHAAEARLEAGDIGYRRSGQGPLSFAFNTGWLPLSESSLCHPPHTLYLQASPKKTSSGPPDLQIIPLRFEQATTAWAAILGGRGNHMATRAQMQLDRKTTTLRTTFCFRIHQTATMLAGGRRLLFHGKKTSLYFSSEECALLRNSIAEGKAPAE
jgi:hypothetical protein